MTINYRIAFDTETDIYEDGHIRTCLIQYCPLDVRSKEDVTTIEGWDCYTRFLDLMENSNHPVFVHCYNLSYEFEFLLPYLLERYEFTDQKPKIGQWTLLADEHKVYTFSFRNRADKLIQFTDDMLRVGVVSLRQIGTELRNQHPEYFEGMTDVKEHVEYNNGWFTDPVKREKMLSYARQDAYTQAKVALWLLNNGMTELTAASCGLRKALHLRYNGKDGYVDKQIFRKKYPPLQRREQDIVERSLLGGYVYANVGDHVGTFTHIDYSSSYPYEYVYGRLPIGKLLVVPGSEIDKHPYLLNNDSLIMYLYVSFDFDLIEGMAPAISGKEIVTVNDLKFCRLNLKVKSGHVDRRLYTSDYLEELSHHFRITNLKIWEYWFMRGCVGDFAPAIIHYYNEKSRPELKGTIQRSVAKLIMNGGIHGKTITKTHRRNRVYFNNVQSYVDVVTEPSMCSLIGFTAMLNARRRLLREFRRAVENGIAVMVTDTDSLVLQADAATVRRVYEGQMAEDYSGIEQIGKFEIETFNGREEFDRIKIWGLKRYCEIDDSTGVPVYRKSAFAGMRNELQPNLLLNWDVYGPRLYWSQLGIKKDKYGKIVTECTKSAETENIYANIDYTIKSKHVSAQSPAIREKLLKMGESARQNLLVLSNEGVLQPTKAVELQRAIQHRFE